MGSRAPHFDVAIIPSLDQPEDRIRHRCTNASRAAMPKEYTDFLGQALSVRWSAPRRRRLRRGCPGIVCMASSRGWAASTAHSKVGSYPRQSAGSQLAVGRREVEAAAPPPVPSLADRGLLRSPPRVYGGAEACWNARRRLTCTPAHHIRRLIVVNDEE